MTRGLENIEPSVRVMGLALYIAADIVSQASDEEDAVVKFEAFAGMAAAQITAMMKDRAR